MSRGRWGVGVIAVVLVVSGAAVGVTRLRHSCGAEVTSASAAQSTSPFLDAGAQRERPDAHRDRLVRTLRHARPPLGEVLGAVGYDYQQWAQVSAYDQGIGVRTRDNPDFTMLDDQTLRPLWSVSVATARSAYDASSTRYLVATMLRGRAPDLVALDARTGHRLWCRGSTGPVVGPSDAFATQFLDGEDVAVLSGGTTSQRLVRLAGTDGHELWSRAVTADHGDFLGTPGGRLLVTGGSDPADLLDPAVLSKRPAGMALVGVSATTGKTVWTLPTPAGSGLHVLGADADLGLVVAERWSGPGPTGTLVALDRAGHEVWTRAPATGAYDAALRAGRVLVRAGSHWAAYDARTGRPLWRRTMPDRPQLLPYGFQLADVPLLDEDHALLGTTTALRTLDLRTGAMPPASSTALPRDGINTTFWPYQVAVSNGLVAVATNTAAVLVRRTR